LELFRQRSSSLWGYAFDLGGSLLGVLGFAAVSWAGLKPVLWFAPPLAAGLLVVARNRRCWALFLGSAAVILAVVHATTGNQRFSPYYALEAIPDSVDRTVLIQANGSLHQVAIDLVTEEGSRQRINTMLGYRHPYQELGRPIRKALVLGAGTGNDVAVLLQRGAAEVHAVEIDPEIIQMGRELHPNNPYADPRVTVYNTDARSFLNETEEQFDVITFGTLDSMMRLSALSNVRLDNFVYTRESLEAAKSRLTADGGLILYFMVSEQYIADHLTALLAATFGTRTRIHVGEYSLFNTTFMAGPAFTGVDSDALVPNLAPLEGNIPTDDWPYLYLRERGVSPFYLSMMAILSLIGVLAILSVSRVMREALRRGQGVDVEMFLYGFAFLLIETKFVTAMNLLWGATWLTSAVVFGSILAVILAGTILTQLRPIPWQVAGVGLVLALLVAYALPLKLLLSTSPGIRLALSILFVGAPILFASLCFAARFKTRPAADIAFGWNLLGAVLGGLTEFFSMWVGAKALTLVAIGAYLGAFLAAQRGAAGGTPTEGADPAGA